MTGTNPHESLERLVADPGTVAGFFVAYAAQKKSGSAGTGTVRGVISTLRKSFTYDDVNGLAADGVPSPRSRQLTRTNQARVLPR